MPINKSGAKMLAEILGLMAIVGTVFAGAEIHYTPRIDFVSHVISSDLQRNPTRHRYSSKLTGYG